MANDSSNRIPLVPQPLPIQPLEPYTLIGKALVDTGEFLRELSQYQKDLSIQLATLQETVRHLSESVEEMENLDIRDIKRAIDKWEDTKKFIIRKMCIPAAGALFLAMCGWIISGKISIIFPPTTPTTVTTPGAAGPLPPKPVSPGPPVKAILPQVNPPSAPVIPEYYWDNTPP